MSLLRINSENFQKTEYLKSPFIMSTQAEIENEIDDIDDEETENEKLSPDGTNENEERENEREVSEE